MQSPIHTATTLDTPLAELSHEMARLVDRFAPEDGLHLTAIPGLKLGTRHDTQPADADSLRPLPVHHRPGP